MNTITSKFRRSRSLVFNFDAQGLVAFDFMHKRIAYINHVGFAILFYANSLVDQSIIFSALGPYYNIADISNELSKFINLKFIVVQGTEEEDIDEKYEKKWVWGTMAGYYHFGIKNPYYLSPEETTNWLVNQIETTPLIQLYKTNEEITDIIQMPLPDFNRDIFSVMRKRRSFRGFESDEGKPIKLGQLRDCLFSGLGIVGFIETPLSTMGQLPIKMTPSGGARNPFEAYLYVRNVEGLKKGIYHHSAVDNSLGFMRGPDDLPSIGDILAVQPWFNNASYRISGGAFRSWPYCPKYFTCCYSQ